MSTPDRRALLDRAHPELSVRRQCTLLSLARSGVYRPVAATDETDLGPDRRAVPGAPVPGLAPDGADAVAGWRAGEPQAGAAPDAADGDRGARAEARRITLRRGTGGGAAGARGFDRAQPAGRRPHLQDHLEFYFQVACTQPISLFRVMNPFAKALVGARWLLRRDGLGATNHFESCGFIRNRAGVRYPDIQFHFLPLAVSYDGRSLAAEHGFQAHVGPMRLKSRGTVRLRSPDPRHKPRILFNYMSHPDDSPEMRACVRLTREIFAQEAFAPYRGREIQPGAGVTDDPAIDAFLRRRGSA